MIPIRRISENDLTLLRREVQPLIGIQFVNLSLPKLVLRAIEPSQIGTIVGVLMDALLPNLDDTGLSLQVERYAEMTGFCKALVKK